MNLSAAAVQTAVPVTVTERCARDAMPYAAKYSTALKARNARSIIAAERRKDISPAENVISSRAI